MSLNNKIGLGSVQFGIPYGVSNLEGQTSRSEVTSILDFALSQGITTIDTASAYGEAESVLGSNNLQSFQVVSKFMPSSNELTLNQQFESSLERLHLDSLYGYLAHRPLDVLTNPIQWDQLQQLKSNNKVDKIGFSLNTPSEIEKLLLEGFIPDLVQVPYNYFDNRFKDILIDLKSKGCEVHTRSAFLQGLFFIPHSNLNPFFNEIKEDLKTIQEQFHENLSGSLLKYVLNLDFVDKVIVGVENGQQLKTNLENYISASPLKEQEFHFSETILMPSNWPKK